MYQKNHTIEWVSISVVNKTIKDTLQFDNSEHKSKELQPLKMFIPYKRGAAEKLRVARKYGLTTTFTKTRNVRGQIQKKQDKIETSGRQTVVIV